MSQCRYFNLIRWIVVGFILQMFSVQLFARDAAHEGALVLVVAAGAEVKKMSSFKVRKLFLSVPVSLKEQRLVSLINVTDDFLFEVFLQKVVYMSERNYERLLVSKTFRSGRPRPERFTDNKKLLDTLNSIQGSFSFMWKKQAEQETRVKIVQVLWEERH